MSSNKLPSLPPKSVSMKGPHKTTNWVVKDKLLCGSVPYGEKMMKTLVEEEIDVYLCLANEIASHPKSNIIDAYPPRERPRTARNRVRPYPEYVSKIMELAKNGEELEFIHFPIRDDDIGGDKETMELIQVIAKHIVEGKKVYVHCNSGHGRTGVIVGLLLGTLYDITATESLNRISWYHDCREDNGNADTPATHDQRMMVYKLLKNYPFVKSIREMLEKGQEAEVRRNAQVDQKGPSETNEEGSNENSSENKGNAQEEQFSEEYFWKVLPVIVDAVRKGGDGNSHKKFKALDSNNDGGVSKDDFRKAVKKTGRKEPDAIIDKVFDRFDTTGDGKLRFFEFVRMIAETD
eukprot:gb/GECH01012320.1/.p1 GENE.gb/GECH01012320.1/~~gb/GECH01012320.1/.p1  ORF type:complete len:349 (+),score=92.01 gb/GECH01012320.1/:1-1047(+)